MIEMFYDNALVRRLPFSATFAGSAILRPDAPARGAQGKNHRCEIVHLGPGTEESGPPPCGIGDIIIVSVFSGDVIREGEEDLEMIPFDKIRGRITKDEGWVPFTLLGREIDGLDDLRAVRDEMDVPDMDILLHTVLSPEEGVGFVYGDEGLTLGEWADTEGMELR